MKNNNFILNQDRRQFISTIIPACALSCSPLKNLVAFGQSEMIFKEKSGKHKFKKEWGHTYEDAFKWRFGYYIEIKESIMKQIFILITTLFFIVCINAKEQNDFPVLKGPYLGQKPPGIKPEVFAPGILNTDKMGAFCTVFSPDGNEFYFVYKKRVKDTPGGLAYMWKVNDVWKKPEMLP